MDSHFRCAFSHVVDERVARVQCSTSTLAQANGGRAIECRDCLNIISPTRAVAPYFGSPQQTDSRRCTHRATWRVILNISDELRARLMKPAFPRASTYDLEWLFDTMMGPNVLWLAEWASQAVPLRKPCVSSTWAAARRRAPSFSQRVRRDGLVADLWIGPTDNWRRIEAAGLTDRVLPVHAEAHALPFAEGYFDAILSFDAYHYFGTDDLYVGYVSKFVRPGGRLCNRCAGSHPGIAGRAAGAACPYWEWEFCGFTARVVASALVQDWSCRGRARRQPGRWLANCGRMERMLRASRRRRRQGRSGGERSRDAAPGRRADVRIRASSSPGCRADSAGKAQWQFNSNVGGQL